MNLHDVLQFSIEVGHEAGALLMNGFEETKRIERKSSVVDLVTQFDQAAEILIANRILSQYPDHQLLGEEGGEQGKRSRYKWHIDPLDGTTNYAHGFPIFTVSIALYEEDKPLVGVVYDPTRQETFSAVRGEGAFLDTPTRQRKSLQVSAIDRLENSLVATGFPFDRHTNPQNNVAELAAFVKRAQGIRRAGSAALDICYIAAGRLDGYWEYRLNPWDVAAALHLVHEAGGQSSDFSGQPLSLHNHMNLVVSNGRIHPQMLETLRLVS